MRAHNILNHGGLDGLTAWIESLPETDQYLLGDWKKCIENLPSDLTWFDVCENPDCEAEQVIFRVVCYSCG